MDIQAGLFLLGTDTEVGKTFQAALLARHLVSCGWKVGVYKPVASGVIAAEKSDAEWLWEASGRTVELARVCPQQFQAPLAPPVAAALEHREVDEELLVSAARWWRNRCDFLIVEGVGGALSPLSSTMTALDLALALQLPVAVVAANRLGAVNHILLTLEAIANRGLRTLGIVLNDLPRTDDTAGSSGENPAANHNQELLARFTPIPIVHSAVQLPLGLSNPRATL